MTTLRSALPVRMSYNVKVRSEPTLARTEASLRLNRTLDTVSVDVEKVRFATGALLLLLIGPLDRDENQRKAHLVSSQIWTRVEAVANRASER
jgi:hypothetical protein